MILHLTSPKRRSSLGKWHNRLDRSLLRKWGRLSRLLIIKPCDWNGGTLTTLICFHSTDGKDFCSSLPRIRYKVPKIICKPSHLRFSFVPRLLNNSSYCAAKFRHCLWLWLLKNRIKILAEYQLSRYLIGWVRYQQLMATISTFNLASHIGCNDFFCNIILIHSNFINTSDFWDTKHWLWCWHLRIANKNK